jgi:hypothetical protein
VNYPAKTYKAILTELIGTGNLFEAGKVHLIKSPIVPDKDTVVADFDAVEADFSGYAEKSWGAWGGVGINALGQAEVTATELEWNPSGAATPNTIYGEYFTDNAGTTLLGWRILTTPVPLTGVDSYYRSVTRIALPADA